MSPAKKAAAPEAASPSDFSRTPGVSDKAEAIEADAPLTLPVAGPPDALVNPGPNDFVPDLEEKGYHAGLVRQPASPLVEDGQMVGFESQGLPSKFEHGSLAHLKAAHNEVDAQRTGDAEPSPAPTAEEVAASKGHENDAG